MLSGTLKQSDVSERFKSLVGIYLDFEGGKSARLGQVAVRGNAPEQFQVKLPQKPKRVYLNAFYDVLATDAVSSGK